MAPRGLEQRVENLERRVESVEQILPTLATKADLAELKAATRADLHAAIAPLATKAEVKAEAETTRRHFDVVAEGLRAEIRVFADKIDAVETRVDARHADVMNVLTRHDRRLTRLEAGANRDEA